MARAALPVTASVVAVALGLAIAVALLLAMIRAPSQAAGLRGGRSLATFLFGIAVFYLLGFKLGRAPPTGYCDFFYAHSDCGGARDWLSAPDRPGRAARTVPGGGLRPARARGALPHS